MRISGGTRLRSFPPEDDLPHPTQNNPNWNESVLLHWYDAKAGLGGFHRIGHEAHSGDGVVTLWSGVFVKNGPVMRHCADFKMTPEDRRANGFGAGKTCRYEVINGRITWTFDEPLVSARLEVHDVHGPLDVWPPDTGLQSVDTSRNHSEAACVIKGEAVIDGSRYLIDGLGYRDHSWGIRHWDMILSHRWITGTFGSDLSFAVTTLTTSKGLSIKQACLFDAERIVFAKAIDVVTYVEADSYTHRGGEVRLELPNGEVIHLRCRPINKGIVSHHNGVTMVQTVCEVQAKDRIGYCTFETTANAQGGRGPTVVADMAVLQNGFHRTP